MSLSSVAQFRSSSLRPKTAVSRGRLIHGSICHVGVLGSDTNVSSLLPPLVEPPRAVGGALGHWIPLAADPCVSERRGAEVLVGGRPKVTRGRSNRPEQRIAVSECRYDSGSANQPLPGPGLWRSSSGICLVHRFLALSSVRPLNLPRTVRPA